VAVAAALCEKRTGWPPPQLAGVIAESAIESPNPGEYAGEEDRDGFSQ